MRPLSELDHYETLEIPRTASREDVERAYRMARATYAEGSLAGHSVFQEGDVPVLRERIELAYRTLVDGASRAAYDAELAARAEEQMPEIASSDPAVLSTLLTPPAEATETLELDELDALDEGEYDGPRLRRARLRAGVELDEIQGVTKVNPTYLRFLEEERFDELPAAVYVRGFVMGYASCLGLDPEVVAKSYMARYRAAGVTPRRRRFARL